MQVLQSKTIIVIIGALFVVVIGAVVLTTNLPSPQTTRPVFVSAVKGASNSYLVREGFKPKEITVVIGVNNTVAWRNDDPGTVHTVNSDSPKEFDSGQIDPGKSYVHTFTKPGSYSYHCDPHPWMVGTVIVKAK